MRIGCRVREFAAHSRHICDETQHVVEEDWRPTPGMSLSYTQLLRLESVPHPNRRVSLRDGTSTQSTVSSSSLASKAAGWHAFQLAREACRAAAARAIRHDRARRMTTLDERHCRQKSVQARRALERTIEGLELRKRSSRNDAVELGRAASERRRGAARGDRRRPPRASSRRRYDSVAEEEAQRGGRRSWALPAARQRRRTAVSCSPARGLRDGRGGAVRFAIVLTLAVAARDGRSAKAFELVQMRRNSLMVLRRTPSAGQNPGLVAAAQLRRGFGWTWAERPPQPRERR